MQRDINCPFETKTVKRSLSTVGRGGGVPYCKKDLSVYDWI